MQSTTVVTSGKGSNPKNVLYVGGLDPIVAESHLYAAFLPFGDVRDVTVPLDYTSGAHRGFGFVEFEEPDDAAAAIENMDNAEFFGRVLRVNYAQPSKVKVGAKGWSHEAAWADADKYFQEKHAEDKTDDIPGTEEAEEKLTEQQQPVNPMMELEHAMEQPRSSSTS